MIGRIFWHGAIAYVAPDLEVDELLDDLLLRDFVLAEPRSTIIGERAFRFKHMLIREVAYAGLTKAERAELHRRFAEWLRERAGDELLEIRAYHLDHATQLLAELDGAAPAELATEAAAALEEAGRRALAREANRSGRKLLLRSVELEPTLERRYHAARAAWRLSDLPAVSVEMRRVLDEARAAGDSAIEGKALTALAEVALLREANLPKATELIDAALEALPTDGRFTALEVRARIAWWVGDFDTQERVAEEALEIAHRLERKDLEAHALNDLAQAYRHQQRLDEAEELLTAGARARGRERQHRRARGGTALARPGQARPQRGGRGRAAARGGESPVLRGRRPLDARAHAERAGPGGRAAGGLREGRAAAARGDPPAEAARGPRRALREPAPLAEVLIRRNHLDEAERIALEAVGTVGEHDVSSRATTTMTLGLVRAAQGRDADAEALLREALAMVEATGFRGIETWVISRLEEFLRERGRDEEAAAYRARLAEFSPTTAVSAAFASRIERIA